MINKWTVLVTVGFYIGLILILCVWGLEHVLEVFWPHTFSNDSRLVLSAVVAGVIWLPGSYSVQHQWGFLKPD